MANNTNRDFGKPNPDFTASYRGFVLNQTINNLNGHLILSSNATMSSLPGNYNIIPSGVSSNNYIIHYTNGTLIVNKVPVEPVINQIEALEDSINQEVGEVTSITSNNTITKSTSGNSYNPLSNLLGSSNINNNKINFNSDNNSLLTLTPDNTESNFTADNRSEPGFNIDTSDNQNISLNNNGNSQTSHESFNTKNNATVSTFNSETSDNNYLNDSGFESNNDVIEPDNINIDYNNSAKSTFTNNNETDKAPSTSQIASNDDNSNNLNSNNNSNDQTLVDETTDSDFQEFNDNNKKDSSNNSNSSNNSSIAWSSAKQTTNNNSSIQIESPQVMRNVFNLCKGKDSCKEIETAVNVSIMEQSILYKSADREYNADEMSTEFLAKVGYHPSGLKGYLLTLAYIENKVKKQQEPENQSNETGFFYRHPKTSLRIQQVNEVINRNNLRTNTIKRLNKTVYNKLLNEEGLTLKSGKVKNVINGLHKIIEKKEYYDAKDQTVENKINQLKKISNANN